MAIYYWIYGISLILSIFLVGKIILKRQSGRDIKIYEIICTTIVLIIFITSLFYFQIKGPNIDSKKNGSNATIVLIKDNNKIDTLNVQNDTIHIDYANSKVW